MSNEPETTTRLRFAALAGITGLVVVALFGLLVARAPAMTRADLSVDIWLSARHVGPLTGLADAIAWLFGSGPATALGAVIVLVILGATRRILTATVVATTLAVSALSNALLKLVVRRPRPDVTALESPSAHRPSDFSYPSGHTAFAVSLAIALVYVAWRTRGRWVVVVVGSIGVVTVAWSRVYLGVHFPTDVAAAAVWAASVCLLVLLLFAWRRSRQRGLDAGEPGGTAAPHPRPRTGQRAA